MKTKVRAAAEVAGRPVQPAPALSTGWAIGLPVLRIGLVAVVSVLTWGVVQLIEPGVAFPPPSLLASFAMLPVNLVCLFLIGRLLRRSGSSIRELLGFDRRRLGRDLAQGVLWLLVLYLPFVGTILLVTWLQHGAELFVRMQTIFFDPAAVPTLNPVAWTVIGVVTALTFAPLNAPAEELLYRGVSQGALARRFPVVLAVLIPSVLFGLQHLWYAATPDAVVTFVCAFFVWGVGSGLIYLRQRRLMPLVLAHGLVDLVFTLPALALTFLMAGQGG
ncbi:MAG: type II CAAX endopeptidase family protein [Micropruina sp.]|uniref:CPBP family intramembrane glutamic endopeptidase n=1 Tax=Micropruina sp. TaxID=2737536 RepID=UPI0039E5CE5F